MRPFQLALIGIFVFLGIAGIGVFAVFKGFTGGSNPYGDRVVIWGTLDDGPFTAELARLIQKDANLSVVSYVEKDERTFEGDLLNALAEGTGPDLIVLSQDMLLKHRSKIAPIPYEYFPERTYRDTYIDGAEVFMLKDGIYATPLAVDPLMMYWNKDIFATKNLSQPPRTWEELVGVTLPTVIERDYSFNILRAAIAMGEYTNVHNAKEILAMLFMQAGSPLVVDYGDRLALEFSRTGGNEGEQPPALAGLTFYTSFSSPTKSVYSWNRALPEDRNEFIAGDLALYFGFASEIHEIRAGNPNFNFDVAELPQPADARLKKGYGTFYGLAAMRNSRNYNGAFLVRNILTSQSQVEGYAQELGFGPVYRASHGPVPQDPFMAVVARSSLVARGWLDPDKEASDAIFKQMVEDTTSGRTNISSALNDAEGRLRQLLR